MFSHMQELLSQQDIKTVRPLSVRMIFEDNHNWDAYSLANKDILRDVEIQESPFGAKLTVAFKMLI